MPTDLYKILQSMARIRMVEQYIAKEYPKQQMKCPTHLCVGQEAVPAVFGILAKPEDVFVGTYRSHGHYLAKGGNLTALFAELLGKPSGCSRGFGGSMHLIDTEQNFMGTSAIVASGIPIAAGAALCMKYRERPSVVLVFFGDAALEEGVTYETANFAVLHKLPLLMVCENNRLAVTTPLAQRQASLNLYNRFESLGLLGRRVAENDLDSLVSTAQEEIAKVRAGHGPSFIEYQTTRFSAHVGHDITGPVNAWWQDPCAQEATSCPLCACACILIKNNELSKRELQEIRDKIHAEIEHSFNEALAAPAYEDINTYEYVYASPLSSLLPQTTHKEAHAPKELNSQEPTKLVNPF